MCLVGAAPICLVAPPHLFAPQSSFTSPRLTAHKRHAGRPIASPCAVGRTRNLATENDHRGQIISHHFLKHENFTRIWCVLLNANVLICKAAAFGAFSFDPGSFSAGGRRETMRAEIWFARLTSLLTSRRPDTDDYPRPEGGGWRGGRFPQGGGVNWMKNHNQDISVDPGNEAGWPRQPPELPAPSPAVSPA